MPAAASCGCDDDRELHGYASLLDALERVPDQRRRQRTRHRAAALAFAVAAVMAGASSVTAMAVRLCMQGGGRRLLERALQCLVRFRVPWDPDTMYVAPADPGSPSREPVPGRPLRKEDGSTRKV